MMSDPDPVPVAGPENRPGGETGAGEGAAGEGAEGGPRPFVQSLRGWLREYFLGEDPTFAVALVPLCFLSIALYMRHPFKTNFIFDEQEALLANPYVRSIADPKPAFHWLDAFRRDFWGLPPDRSIGSYRPIPDLVWRALWGMGARAQSPFLHHWVNVLLHGVNGALLVVIAFKVTKNRLTAWLTGTVFVASAVLTEAVSGDVGIADVLGALGALLAVATLALPLRWMPLALMGATLFGLFSKESALVIVPLVPFAALLTAHITHPDRPKRWLRAALAAVVAGGAFLIYVEARRRLFPSHVAVEYSVEANAGKHWPARAYAALLRWYAQPALPRDPLNNPLIEAKPAYRIAGALRVYARGVGQVLFPKTLSGDYSAPQEPIPAHLVFPESILGALLAIGPVAASLVLGWRAIRDAALPKAKPDLRPAAAVALMWMVVSYFPVSNIPVLLPTVRAERFWYFPSIGSAVILAIAWRRLLATPRRVAAVAAGALVLFVGFQCYAARRHAFDYTNDLVFWNATRKAAPRSAKAHLNYSVMLGARGDLEGRLASNEVALRLAPQWPMANVYEGDTLCRLHRAVEALPHYLRGFSLGSNDMNLIALGLQCLWDEHQLEDDSPTRDELQELADQYPGSWLKYLVDDILENGEKDHGVNPKYRPRGY